MSEPLVSVVMATYNRATLLSRSLDSLLRQTYPAVEIIVVNDASEDNTADVLAALTRQHAHLRVINLPENEGITCRNRGIKVAQGTYVAIMDDDDVCLPDRIEKQVAALKAHPEADLCFAAVDLVDEHERVFNTIPDNLLEGRFPTEPEEVFRLLLLDGCRIPDVTLMIRREVFLNYLYWPVAAPDWAILLSMAADGVRMVGVPEALVRVNRAWGHKSLWQDKAAHFHGQYEVLRRVCQEKDVPPALARRATSNLIIREARYVEGGAALGLILRALILWPGNPLAYRALKDVGKRAATKLRRMLYPASPKEA